MWIVEVALRRPYTFLVMALLILLTTPLVLLKMSTDIFPDINIPVISIVWTYGGLSAQEVTQRITAVNERSLTTTVMVAIGTHNTLIGGQGPDILQGDSGFNLLFGGPNTNTLFGVGSDTLMGGSGTSALPATTTTAVRTINKGVFIATSLLRGPLSLPVAELSRFK